MKSKISIIIPVYNVEKYLRQCLDSVVNQTLKELQIICVDDGSTDGSLDILNEYAERDSRFVILRQNHKGGGAARNLGMAAASGEYIYHMDADDYIDLTLCEKAYNAACKTGVDGVSFFYRLTPESKKIKIPTYAKYTAGIKTDIHDRFETVAKSWAPWSCLWKADFLKKFDIKFPEHVPSHDMPFSIECAVASAKMEVLHETLYNYRILDGSISHKEKNYPYLLRTTLETLERVQKYNIDTVAYELIFTRVMMAFSGVLADIKDAEIRLQAKQMLLEELPLPMWEQIRNSQMNFREKYYLLIQKPAIFNSYFKFCAVCSFWHIRSFIRQILLPVLK